MVAKTTDTTNFNLDFSERCGKELRSGYDLRTARRSLNIMLIDWAARGLNFWTIESDSIALTAGTASYNVPVDTVDLLETVIRTGSGTTQTDISITRIPMSTYATIPNKNATGKPIQMWFDRQTGATDSTSVVQYPKVYLYPVPDSAATYTLVYWRMRRMYDAGNGVNGQDVPYRFLPAMTAGLAYHLSFKIPEARDRIDLLKAVYEEEFQRASEMDRERVPMRLRPKIARI